jgi:hypothetical protein
MSEYHAKAGWFFERMTEGNVGSVVIVKREYGVDNPKLLLAIAFYPDEWASIVASVSARGDTAVVHSEALELHNKLATENG